jgi:pyridoxine 5-phosphate synthase
MASTVLSVNLNKIAVLRNSRGGDEPDVLKAARTCIAAGAGGITVHPRPDLRHIRPDDVAALKSLLAAEHPRIEFNIEGNASADANARGYPGFIALVAAARPAQCTLVPDGDAQITSDHGFDLARDAAVLKPQIAALRRAGCRVSLFVDMDVRDVALAAEIGAQRIEIYTGPFAHDFARGDAHRALDLCARTAEAAARAGLGVNAGHDLSQANLGAFLHHVPGVHEVSIGHALIGEALYDGLDETVRRYLGIIASA